MPQTKFDEKKIKGPVLLIISDHETLLCHSREIAIFFLYSLPQN